MPVEHEALGTGAPLDRAKRGGIDAVIAHARALEERFIADAGAAFLTRGGRVADGDPRLLNILSILPVNPGGRRRERRWRRGVRAVAPGRRGPGALIGEFGRAEQRVALFLQRDQIPIIDHGT